MNHIERDDSLEQHVLAPLTDARKGIGWLIGRLRRGQMTPKLARQALGKISDRLKQADAYFVGLES